MNLRSGGTPVVSVAVVSAVIGLACADDPSAPDLTRSVERSAAASAHAGPVIESASGGANVRLDGVKRTLSFHANKRADGSVHGRFELVKHPGGARGEVTCLTVVGSEAWIGGVATDGRVFGWQVLDGGEGVDAGTDRVSWLHSWPNYAGTGFSDWFCASRPSVLAFDVNAGNVQVKGKPALFTLVYANDFEESVGAEWSDATRSTSPSGRVFLGDFANHTVALTLDDLPRHRYLRISFDLYVLRTMDGSDTTFGLDLFTFDEQRTGFSFPTTFSGYGGEQAFPGRYPESTHWAYAGATEINSLGYAWIDPDGTPVPMDVVFPVEFTIAHTDDAAVFGFEASGLQDFTDASGNYTDESWGIDNVRVQAIR